MRKFSILLSVTFLAAMLAAVVKGYIPRSLILVYLAVSIVTFIAYAFDKSKARRGVWRTPESTLHLLALFGGWPGAAIAQQTLRHKSQKRAFRVAFWLTVIANCSTLFWFMSSH
jgi:uncharacterized membrane protein YsdA (DUF1294 family)